MSNHESTEPGEPAAPSPDAADTAPTAADTAAPAAPPPVRDPNNGRWQKGTPSPNPGGKPKGMGWHAEQRLELRKAVNPLFSALFQAALKGDTKASEILLSRVLPAARIADDESGFTLPANASPAEQSKRVLTAMAKGTLTPGQAADQLAVIQSAMKVIEQTEMMAEMQAMRAEFAALKGRTA